MLIDVHEQERRMERDAAEVRIGEITGLTPFYAGVEYTPPARGTWTIAHTPMLVPESHEIFVCPDGCLRGVVLSADEGNFADRFSMISVTEEDVYAGGMEELFVEGVSDIVRNLPVRPRAVQIFSSCIHDFLALDDAYVYAELRRRFPDIDFIECQMNCTMRKSKLTYEEVQWRQNYAGLRPRPKDPGSVNIIGNYFALDRGSEPMQMLESSGHTVRDICRARTYDEYLEMGASPMNLYLWPVAGEACRDLQERLGQEAFYLPFTWDPEEIRSGLTALADKTGARTPGLDALEEKAAANLARTRSLVGDTEIRIDAQSTPRPFGLAELLIRNGFNVTEVYSDAVLPGDDASFHRLQNIRPDLLMSAMVDFRLRTRARDAAERAAKTGGIVLAVGQRAAYFTGTDHFVNMIANDGLYGFTGIAAFADRLADAYRNAKDARTLIQIKARGCDRLDRAPGCAAPAAAEERSGI